MALLRTLSALSLAIVAGLAAFANAHAQEPPWRHATSLVGEIKYPPGFAHFDYVNVNAPKGGVARLSSIGSFDSFNPILPKGEAAPGIGLMFETLMTSSLDEISTMYGLVAEALQYPDDYSWVKYRLRPEARWHDGKPITAEDVAWSFRKLVELNPSQRFYYQHVKSAEITGAREVLFTFDQPGNKELPHIVGQLIVLPKHWWEGKDANGNVRDIGKTTLEPPMGSGPYRVKNFAAGRRASYERVPDYWGAKLPVNLGSNNIEEIRYEVFLDQTVMLEAFKGNQYDWRVENSAKDWATGYDHPAVKEGRIVKEEFPDRSSGIMQAFVVNLRRDKFADPRVRRALNLAFDFETLNRTTFFGQYKRDDSFFAGTELASSGVPSGKELEILGTVRGKVPENLFTEPYRNPVGGDAAKVRENLREALKLLNAAGWQLKGNRLVNEKTGQPLRIEYLAVDPNFERVVVPFQQSLRKIGIEFTLRFVDTSQYVARLRSFDFDMITFGWPQSLSPGNEQRDYWGSTSAGSATSRNFAGIKDPAVDALIERVIFAKDRAELVAATKALDRVLLWNDFVIPQWYLDRDRVARWDRFSHPDPLPKYSVGFPAIWWYDEAKAAKTGAPK